MNNDDLIKYYERRFGPFIHMAPADKAIWVRYLIAGGHQYAPFEYDLRVGDGLIMPETSSSFAIKSAHALTTKRIDAVAWNNDRVMIIEVKQRAGLSAIGQLLGYKNLYQYSFNTRDTVDLWLVTDKLQPDMIAPLIASKINYVEV